MLAPNQNLECVKLQDWQARVFMFVVQVSSFNHAKAVCSSCSNQPEMLEVLSLPSSKSENSHSRTLFDAKFG
jgi:hypothetical protein